jgi:pilus assembly protein CpaB
MNTQRMLILGVAAVAAGAAALLARGLIGGGTQTAKAIVLPPRPVTTEVLVAASDLQPGTALTPSSVRWQEWPKSSVDSSFITQNGSPDVDHVIQGTVVRAPLVAGEPLATTKFVHADAAGVMAAMVTPGMRAVSTSISTENDVGGFILPNDRVDVMVTASLTDNPRRPRAFTFMRDVRVLAVDQTYHQDKDAKSVLAKTVTLEVTPAQAELFVTAQSKGPISLSLRALGDSGAQKTDKSQTDETADNSGVGVRVIGYGTLRAGSPGQEN